MAGVNNLHNKIMQYIQDNMSKGDVDQIAQYCKQNGYITITHLEEIKSSHGGGLILLEALCGRRAIKRNECYDTLLSVLQETSKIEAKNEMEELIRESRTIVADAPAAAVRPSSFSPPVLNIPAGSTTHGSILSRQQSVPAVPPNHGRSHLHKTSSMTLTPHQSNGAATTSPLSPMTLAGKRARLSSTPGSGESMELEADGFVTRPPGYQLFGNHNDKGYVLIINNDFKDSPNPNFPERSGSDKDVERIKEVFTLPCANGRYVFSKVHRNVTMDRLYDVFDETKSELQRMSPFSILLLFILSHGEQNGIAMFPTSSDDTSYVELEKITDTFDDVLPDRPKVFVIQACRGERDQGSEPVSPDCLSESQQCLEQMDFTVDSDVPRPPKLKGSDELICMPTVKGYKSYRGRSGSWYIQTMMDILKKNPYWSFIDVLTQTNAEVAEKIGLDVNTRNRSYVKQVSMFQSTLRKSLYLFPQYC